MEIVLVVVVALVAGMMMLGLVIAGALIARDTVRQRGNFGINLKPIHCPKCDEPAPPVRAPKNWNQALWGGCTCGRCGTEYDKWGRVVGRIQDVAERNDAHRNPDA